MENLQEYLESGILEQYALGELSAAEQAAVEARAAQDPAVRTELASIQAALEGYAEAHALTPPAGLRERVLGNVLARIAATAPVPASSLRADVDALAVAYRPAAAAPSLPAEDAAGGVVRPFAPAPAAARPAARSGWALAASVALLLSLGGNFLLYSGWKNAKTELVALQNDRARIAATTQVVQREVGALRQQTQVLRNDEFRAVALAGTKDAPTARARVLFNPATHQVYVDVKRLPALPAGKQYQLWALAGGKPVDAGVLAAATATGAELQLMKTVASAQGFAVTVEPVGGSVAPTMPIQAVGTVAI